MRISRRGIYTRNYTRKSPENVYMMKKTDIINTTEEKRRMIMMAQVSKDMNNR